MLSLDLFDSRYEKRLHEGAVDDTITRTQAHLMEPLSRRAADIRTQIRSGKLSGAELDKLEKEYEDLVQKRLDIMLDRQPKNEQQVPSKMDQFGRPDPFAYVKPEPEQKGIAGNLPANQIPGKNRLLKGKGSEFFGTGKPMDEAEPYNPLDQLPLPSQTRPTPGFGTRTHAQNVFFEILKAWEDERDYIVIPFPNAPNPVTMIRGQIWNAIADLSLIKDPKRRAKYVEERFNDFDSFMSWLGNLKRYKVPAKKKGITPSLPLPIPQQPTVQAQQPTVQAQPTAPGSPLMDPEFTGIKPPGNLQEKKKSNDLDAKDVGLSRELQKARARFPAAASDLEAGILDQMDQQQQAQQALAQQQADLNRQDQQIAGLAQANQQQDGVMRAQGQEIDRLTQRLQQVMTQPTAPAAAPVTTQAQPTAPAAAPAPDMVYVPDVPADTATQDREIARLDKQIQQLELMMALKTPAERSDLEDRIQALEKARAAQQEKKRASGAKGAETRKKNQQTKQTKDTLKKSAGDTDKKQNTFMPGREISLADPDNRIKDLFTTFANPYTTQIGDQNKSDEPSKIAAEGKMNKIDVLRQELQRMGPQRFKQVYGMTAAEVMAMDRPAAQQDVPMQAPRFRDAQGGAQLEHSRMAEGQPQELINRYLAIDAETDVEAVRKAIQAISRDSTLSATSKSRLLGQIGMIIQRHRLPLGRAYYKFMQQYMEDISETALNPNDPKDDYEAKRRALHDLSLNKDVDQQAVLQRRLDLDREAKAKGLAETVTNVKAGMAEIYRRLAPKIERHRDSFLAGQLYDELENYAELHGAEGEFKRMMSTARSRAHMEYDTNPGGFQNWFWFLPFEDDSMTEGTDDVKKRMSKLEALALAANRAGDDAKCKMYQQKIQSLKQKLSQSMAEGWSDQGNPTAYSVYIDGREWRAYKSDEQARRVADKVQANLKLQGRDQTVTIAPSRTKRVQEDFGMPGNTIPRKSIIQGYTVYWNPNTQMVSVTRGGDSEQAAIEQARVRNINKDRFLAAAYRMIDRIEELAENISREPRTARERDDMIDKIQRMMTQDRNPANLQIMKKDIEILKTKYRDLKEDSDSREAVEMAIMRRMLVAHTDLIMRHGLDVVVAAIEEVAYDVGEVDEIGTSDVSAYVRRVERILEPDNEV